MGGAFDGETHQTDQHEGEGEGRVVGKAMAWADGGTAMAFGIELKTLHSRHLHTYCWYSSNSYAFRPVRN